MKQEGAYYVTPSEKDSMYHKHDTKIARQMKKDTEELKRLEKINEALEHGCTFVDHVAIDDMGNEYRDENGAAIFDY